MNIALKNTKPVFNNVPQENKLRIAYTVQPSEQISFNDWMQYIFKQLKTKNNGK